MFIERISNSFGAKNKIQGEDWFLASMAFGIPFSIKVGNLLLIIGLLFSCYILMVKDRTKLERFINFHFVFPIAFFLVILLSSFLSKDVGAGLKQVEKNILLIIIPFAIVVLQGNRRVNEALLLGSFTLATFVSTIALLIAGIFRVSNGSHFNTLFFHEFGSFLDLHPVYIAIGVSISIFFLCDKYLKPLNKNSLKSLPLIFFFYLILILCSSKAVLMIFIIVHVIHLLTILKGRNKYLAVPIVLFFVFLIGTTSNTERFKDGLHFDITEFNPTDNIAEAKVFSSKEKADISDLELRYIMVKIGLYHLWAEEKVFFGYGVGDVQHYTDYHYMIYNLAPGWYEGYNLHNQYLQYLVTFGIMVTLLFCCYLAYSFKIAIQSGNSIYLLFLLLMVMVFLAESILSRNKGIVIFYFFNTLFLISNLNENRNFRNKRYTK